MEFENRFEYRNLNGEWKWDLNKGNSNIVEMGLIYVKNISNGVEFNLNEG